jgi:hypothetical protein
MLRDPKNQLSLTLSTCGGQKTNFLSVSVYKRIFSVLLSGSLFCSIQTSVAQNALVNGNFEADPYDSNWSISVGIQEHTGLVAGSTKAAFISVNSANDLVQNLPNSLRYSNPPAGTRGEYSSTGPIWRLSFHFACSEPPTSTGRSLNMLVAHDSAGLAPQINLRVLADGQVQAFSGTGGLPPNAWETIFPAGTIAFSELSGNSFPTPTVYYMQIDGDYTTYSPSYTVSLRLASANTFSHVKTTRTAWQYGAPKPLDGVTRLRFHGAVQSPYVIDNVALESLRAPYLATELNEVRTRIDLRDYLGGGNSSFNPRIFDGTNYVLQVNSPVGWGAFPSGSTIPTTLVSSSSEHRMVAPFRGANRGLYFLASGSGAAPNALFSRYNLDGSERVDASAPGDQTVEGFDWVDENTIICTSYTSGNRRRLYLATVQAEPFSVTLNTLWNNDGYVTSAATMRLRNVRTGGTHTNFAYYGDNQQNSNPAFFAINLTTGQETLLGNLGTLEGGGSFGLWTVVERNGYLYVQTTDNGILVYQMTGPTTLGSQVRIYTKAELDQLTGNVGQFFGLDVNPDGTKLLLSGLEGKSYELATTLPQPPLYIVNSNENVIVSWPTPATGYVLESNTDLSSDFWPETPYIPATRIDNKSVTIPKADGEFYRLRK